MKKKVFILLIFYLFFLIFISNVSASLNDGLIAYYKLDGNTNDYLGIYNGINYRASNTEGKLRNAYYFDGDSYILLNNSENINFGNTLTLSAWVYPLNSWEEYGSIIGKYNNGTNTGRETEAKAGINFGSNSYNQAVCDFSFEPNSTKPTLYDAWLPAYSVPKGKWTLVTCIYNGSSVLGYANGNLVRNNYGVGARTLKHYNASILIGALKKDTELISFGFEKIDEVKIWNRALTNEEVKQAYDNDVLAGDWRFEEIVDNKIKDYSVFSNNLSVFSSSLRQGKVGNALDVSSGYADAGNDSVLNPAYEFTISFWINPSQIDYSNLASEGAVILTKSDASNGYKIFIDKNKNLIFSVLKNGIQYFASINASRYLSLESWNKLDFIFLDNSIRIYVDGIQEAYSPAFFSGSNTNLTIGKLNNYNSFNGLIDELKIFNYGKKSQEIKANFGQIQCNDKDNDGYGSPNSSLCLYSGLDCDDSNDKINPNEIEISCNSIDEDCDGYDFCLNQSLMTIKVNHYSLGYSPENFASQGIPFKQGLVFDENNLKLEDNGQEIPLATKVLTRWNDNSIKSVLIQFNTVFGQETKDYLLKIAPRSLNQNFIPVAWDLGKMIITLSPEVLSYSSIVGDEIPIKYTPSQYKIWIDKQLENYYRLYVMGAVCPTYDQFYDAIHTSYQIYARTGSLDVLINARKFALHHRRDQLYTTGSKAGKPKCDNGAINEDDWDYVGDEPWIDVTRYSYMQGLVDDYYFWGDNQDINVSAMIANVFMNDKESRYYLPNGTRGHFNERDAAFTVIGLTALYDATKNQTYLDSVTKKVNLLYKMQIENGGFGWLHNLEDHDPGECDVRYNPKCNTTYGVSPWMTGLLLEGIIDYYKITGSINASDSLFMNLNYLKNNCLGQGPDSEHTNNGFKYLCGVGGYADEQDNDNLITHAFAYGYKLTGNIEYYNLSKRVFNLSSTRGYVNAAKQYNQQFRSSGHTLAYLNPNWDNPGQASCVLTSAYWNITSVNEDNYAKLIVNGTNCTGSVSFNIWEKDTESGNTDDLENNTITAIFADNQAVGIWKSHYQDDNTKQETDPPEYYFTASVSGRQIQSSNILTVNLILRKETSFTINIQEGINFIGIPIILKNKSLENITFKDKDKIRAIYSYNNSWKWHYPSNPNLSNLQEIEAGKGYVIIANQSFSLNLAGYKLNETLKVPKFHLNRGWNLISTYSSENKFSYLFSGFNSIFGYNSGYYSINSNDLAVQNKAYWIYMNSQGEYTPVTGK